MKPLAIDLFCGLGGWTEGLLAEGYYVVGFDNERHQYGDAKYPAQLVLQDVMTIHGKQFKDAALIVASPPCQEYSYMAMPWSRAKAIAAEYKSGVRDVKNLTALFDACFRIQREAIEAAGHFIPLVVENVRGAQKWVGRSRWNYGSFHLWGDVPALMPMTKSLKLKTVGPVTQSQVDQHSCHINEMRDALKAASVDESGVKAPGMNWSNPDLRGQDFTRLAGKHAATKICDCGHTENDHDIGSDAPCCKCSCINPRYVKEGMKTAGHANIRDGHPHTRHLTNQAESDGVKLSQSGAAWFDGTPRDKMLGNQGHAAFGSKSSARKAASAAIAKIPLPLARYIAAVYKPVMEIAA